MVEKHFTYGNGVACPISGGACQAFDGEAADHDKNWAVLAQRNVARLQSCIVNRARIAAVHSDRRDAIRRTPARYPVPCNPYQLSG